MDVAEVTSCGTAAAIMCRKNDGQNDLLRSLSSVSDIINAWAKLQEGVVISCHIFPSHSRPRDRRRNQSHTSPAAHVVFEKHGNLSKSHVEIQGPLCVMAGTPPLE